LNGSHKCQDKSYKQTDGEPEVLRRAKALKKLLEELGKIMDLAKEELLLKEITIRAQVKAGLMPFSAYYNLNLDHYFRTIGVLGFNEMCLNFAGTDITQNVNLVFKVLKFMRDRILEYQKETGKLFNIEMRNVYVILLSWILSLRMERFGFLID
jgi:hypothetical protein